MMERKKKLLSLLLTSSLVFSITGCNKNTEEIIIKKDNNITNNGKIDIRNLERYYGNMDNFFIVVIKNLKNETELYLTNSEYINGVSYRPSFEQYEIIGTNINITTSLNNYESNYGKVLEILPFKQFIPLYCDIKDVYKAEEIVEIFESLKKDYNELIKNENVKKLELKK